jgi:hypothetical protein
LTTPFFEIYTKHQLCSFYEIYYNNCNCYNIIKKNNFIFLKELIMRRNNLFYILYFFAVFFTFTACEMSDKDRCDDKYEWDADQAACVIPVDTDVTDTSEVQDGLGDVCHTDTDCTTEDYNFCLLDPTNPDAEGMCTFSDCSYSDCGGDFQCCDCTSVTFLGWDIPYCVDAGSAELLTSMCSCE